ncbi:hypothetical protein D5086_028731 [Populus alba]|uniref:Uncharacterized protein n=1 Tax=Populus alba TaxID=43335 RepID=A0ACC4ARP6_POPAL
MQVIKRNLPCSVMREILRADESYGFLGDLLWVSHFALPSCSRRVKTANTGTLEPFRWGLATVNKDLKSNGYNDTDVEKLSLNGGAKTYGSIQVKETLKHWTACILGTTANTNVDQST